MTATSDLVQIVLQMKNTRQFVSDATKASGSVKKVGDESEKAGKKGRIGAKGLALWGGAAAALVGATAFVKSAVSATEDLAKGTLAMQRTTGLDIKTSSEWAAVLKVRGVEANTFQRSLVKLEKEMEKTRKGTKKHNSALEQLGFTSHDAAIRTGDVQQVMFKAADAFKAMHNPAKRAALAQTLFGRQSVLLAPLLLKGSEALKEQLGMADKYGATLSGKTADAVKEQIAHQRELKLAMLGVKVQLGTALMPVLLTVSELIFKLTQLLSPLTKNALAFKIVLIALAAALILYKIAMLTAAIATGIFDVAAAPIVGIVLGIVAALVLLGIAAYFVVKHWDSIKAAGVRVWGWIKANWPLLVGILTGPFGLAVALIIKHFDKIKGAATAVIDWIIKQFHRLTDFFGNLHFPHIDIPGSGLIDKATGILPFAQGGTMPRTGTALVGERGPELLTLPGGSHVTPLASPAGSLAGAGGFGEIVVPVQVMLDKRVLAEAVARYTSDKVARR